MMTRAILPIMTDAEVSRDTKRKTLNTLVIELSDRTFANGMVAKQIMEIINMKEEVCKEYDDTNAQVVGILSWLPRMSVHRDKLAEEVKKHRKSYGLKL
jgi:hypothetical protein